MKGLRPEGGPGDALPRRPKCPTQATPPQATRLFPDTLLQVRSHLSPLLVSILILVAFHQWEEVLIHQHQVAATRELGAILHLEVIQPLGAILAPSIQGQLQPILEVKALEPHLVEQAFLATHSPLHSLMVVDQPRFLYQVAFLGDRCRLSTLEDKLLTLASLLL